MLLLTSLNLWGVPDFVHLLHPNKSRLHNAISRFVGQSPADLLVVQELWSQLYQPHRQIFSQLGILPAWLDRRQDSGLGFRVQSSAWKLTSWAQQNFRARAVLSDSLKKKGFVRLELENNQGQRVTVFNTHLQAETWMPVKSAVARQNQIRELLAAVVGCTGPVVLVGDFNLAERHPTAGIYDRESMELLERAGFQDAFLRSGDAPLPSHTNGERYDRIWLSPGITVERIWTEGGHLSRWEAHKLSDHYPLNVQLVLPG